MIIDKDDLMTRNLKTQPFYIWFSANECYRVVEITISETILLQLGRWLPPIPCHERKNKNIDLYKKYPNYSKIVLANGIKYLDAVRTRKDSSEIVAWESSGMHLKMPYTLVYDKMMQYVLKQKWKCRYCGTVNDGGLKCQGKSIGCLPAGGPKKANNNVLLEYQYFLSRSNACMPYIHPFAYEPDIPWFNNEGMYKYQETHGESCGAHRCIHHTHVNQSDQILSFPRKKWLYKPGYVENTEQFYLPGAMLGHQVSKYESHCPKCRQYVKPPLHVISYRKDMEHLWWTMEVLYWLKVEIYNKKMQKLPNVLADKRYIELKSAIDDLIKLNVGELVYHGDIGQYQTVPFNCIITPLVNWIANKSNYDLRFEKKV